MAYDRNNVLKSMNPIVSKRVKFEIVQYSNIISYNDYFPFMVNGALPVSFNFVTIMSNNLSFNYSLTNTHIPRVPTENILCKTSCYCINFIFIVRREETVQYE